MTIAAVRLATYRHDARDQGCLPQSILARIDLAE
jgi:hypothetical protein